MPWLLCDYGQVLSLSPDEADIAALCEETGLGETEFVARYWAPRLAYDRGDLSAGEFWHAVLGSPLEADRLERVVALDVASWTRPDRESLEAVGRAAERGYRLAVLSNAPREIARVLDGKPWLQAFSPRLFSCDLGEVKPAAAIYRQALEALAAPAAEVVFVDDSEANVTAAMALGIDARRFTGPEVFDALADAAQS